LTPQAIAKAPQGTGAGREGQPQSASVSDNTKCGDFTNVKCATKWGLIEDLPSGYD
jgi:hypothetical protein